MIKLLLKLEKGMALLEVVLALGLMMIILTAIVNVVLTSLNNAQYSKNLNIASQYAEEGIEMIREVKEDSWTTLNSYEVGLSDEYCLNSDLPLVKRTGAGFGCPDSTQNIDSFFVRKVKFEKLSSGDCVSPAILATVSVAWSSGKCPQATDPFCHSAKSVSCFYEL